MKSEIKTKWIKALKSGAYDKCEGTLYENGSYCAYGVLCDIYAKEKGVQFKNVIKRRRSNSILPNSVSTWAGLGNIRCEDEVVVLNDRKHYTLKQIGEYLESKGE